jgi:hypothetical protein
MSAGDAIWLEANQRYLTAAFAVARGWLDGKRDAGRGEPERIAGAMSSPPALEQLVAGFALTPFERGVLLMCAGVEMDTTFAARVAAAHGDPSSTQLTFALALASVPEAHWSAISPSRPLRALKLVELAGPRAVSAALRIDERVLHYLAGLNELDERLAPLVEPSVRAESLAPSQERLAERCVRAWGRPDRPLLVLTGDDARGKPALAAAACVRLGRRLWIMHSAAVPQSAVEADAVARLWLREVTLGGAALLVDCDGADEVPRAAALALWLERAPGPVVLTVRQPPALRRPLVNIEIPKPPPLEQRTLWLQALGPRAAALDGELDRVVAQFRLSSGDIRSISERHREADGGALWDLCRAEARPRLDDLAQRIEPAASWDDLVLPELQRQVLRDIVVHVRQRATVYERWGFAGRSSRGLGVPVLFSGASGTGKTMAAEVLAAELKLDLYRIDLSQVVSKYIGETERNLRKVFDAGEDSSAVLLFDEADALFGKRSEVKDSHDRYANIEVSYLLQRMEAYRGLAILTTNQRESLDTAFLRRLRFAVQFPFPDAGQRAEIWRRVFPSKTPTAGLQTDKLARLSVPGGNIRNIALNAAFLAANEGSPVRMAHVLRATRAEFLKLERPLTEAEIGGWA